MAKKKTSAKKTSKRTVKKKESPVKEIQEPIQLPVQEQVLAQEKETLPVSETPKAVAPLLEIPYHEKKHVLLKGIALHLMVYTILGLTLALIGVPYIFIFIVLMFLVWGLIVISHHYYHKK